MDEDLKNLQDYNMVLSQLKDCFEVNLKTLPKKQPQRQNAVIELQNSFINCIELLTTKYFKPVSRRELYLFTKKGSRFFCERLAFLLKDNTNLKFYNVIYRHSKIINNSSGDCKRYPTATIYKMLKSVNN